LAGERHLSIARGLVETRSAIMDVVLSVLGAVALFFALNAAWSSFYTVCTAEAAIVARLGEFL
jgi:hypothetical protein